MSTTEKRQNIHSSFTLERTYEAPAAEVFKALSDKDAMAVWFGGPEGLSVDFRLGGGTVSEGSHEGTTYKFASNYRDIVPNERIIYGYDMWVNGDLMSVSVTTITFEADGDRTRLVHNEQGVFLDGLDTSEAREHGTNDLLDALGESVER